MTNSAESLYEQLLVLRYRAGDDQALVELVHRYNQRLRRYIRKLTGDQAGTEDILQETWIVVMKQLPRLRHPASFTTWLYRIARNLSYKELRRAGQITLTTIDDEMIGSDESCDPVHDYDMTQIHDALDQLKPQHRDVLLLRILEDMSYENIATVIGCAVGTVRSRLHYARGALRTALEGSDHDR